MRDLGYIQHAAAEEGDFPAVFRRQLQDLLTTSDGRK